MKKLLFFMLLLAIVYTSDSVFASPGPPSFHISCTPKSLNYGLPSGYSYDNGHLTFSSIDYYNFAKLHDRAFGTGGTEDFGFLIFQCQEDVESIKSELRSMFKNHSLSIKNSSWLYYETTLIVPYNETIIENNKNNLDNIGNCYFEKVYKLGDFVVIKGGKRDYCYLWSTGGCPFAKISHLQFLGFLLANPNANTLPYLFGYLAAMFFPIAFITYLFKRKELKFFFKLNKLSLALLLVLSIFIFIFLSATLFFSMGEIIILIILFYFFLSLIRYVYFRIKKK